MQTLLILIGVSMVSLLLLAIYACFVVSGRCARDEERMESKANQEMIE